MCLIITHNLLPFLLPTPPAEEQGSQPHVVAFGGMAVVAPEGAFYLTGHTECPVKFEFQIIFWYKYNPNIVCNVLSCVYLYLLHLATLPLQPSCEFSCIHWEKHPEGSWRRLKGGQGSERDHAGGSLAGRVYWESLDKAHNASHSSSSFTVLLFAWTETLKGPYETGSPSHCEVAC